ncbi:putative transcriptional regulatory protein [Wickerhamomyces ciferrii]|uniref:Transcriptional regulatory protein n=1 Tax=Wickerhamomyces ciferrii (strain ATCC 14091 / BCRC 22168 / CBS 111 / JCM 3599 / NBRC 0793 / NRRL Y-1031 F-60-10) TaxID=1206466 RepID=K0KJA0_WICCF|nr:putative transcriptional regulatory protein [Wickerhamomyces ciferrii]CCH41188.1 putative transcriptional regulatory protein [Wickerhamomyces ciferrii]
MPKTKDYQSPCISCKLRRTRCDRKSPICSSCASINLPQELCHYKDFKINLKDKNSKETLNILKQENEELKKELEELKNETTKKVQISTSFKLHHGSSSWASPLTSQPQFENVVDDIIPKIKNELNNQTEIRKMMMNLLETNESINLIKERINRLKIGLDTLEDYSLLEDSIKVIEKALPNYEYITKSFKNFFKFGTSYGTFMNINYDSFWLKYYKLFSEDTKTGFIQINSSLKFPRDLDQVTFLVLFLAFLIYIIFAHLHHTKNPLDKSDIKTNPIILTEYCKILSNVLILYINFEPNHENLNKILNLDHLQGIVQINVFDTFSTGNKFSELIANPKGAGGILNNWKVINIAKMMKLNEDIDLVYAHKDAEYRQGLKQIWYYLSFVNLAFSLEVGMMGKIKPEEIRLYSSLSDNNLPRSLKILNKVCYDFEFIEINSINFQEIHDFFIYPIHNLMELEFTPLIGKINQLNGYDLNNPEECYGFREIASEFSIHILAINALTSIYSFCERKSKLESNELGVQKYKLLKLKTMILLINIGSLIFQSYQRFMNHPDAYSYSPLLTLLHLYIRIRRTFRRVGISISSQVFQNLKKLKRDEIDEILTMNDEEMNRLVDNIIEETGYDYDELNVEDLENWSIEGNSIEMERKFQILNDDEYLLISIIMNLQKVFKSFETPNYNLEFFKNNTTFRFFFKITRTLLILIHKVNSNDTQKQVEPTSRERQKSRELEFNFGEFFQKAFETTQYGFIDPVEIQKEYDSSMNMKLDDKVNGYCKTFD